MILPVRASCSGRRSVACAGRGTSERRDRDQGMNATRTPARRSGCRARTASRTTGCRPRDSARRRPVPSLRRVARSASRESACPVEELVIGLDPRPRTGAPAPGAVASSPDEGSGPIRRRFDPSSIACAAVRRSVDRPVVRPAPGARQLATTLAPGPVSASLVRSSCASPVSTVVVRVTPSAEPVVAEDRAVRAELDRAEQRSRGSGAGSRVPPEDVGHVETPRPEARDPGPPESPSS